LPNCWTVSGILTSMPTMGAKSRPGIQSATGGASGALVGWRLRKQGR
jgi:hypothetical protein